MRAKKCLVIVFFLTILSYIPCLQAALPVASPADSPDVCRWIPKNAIIVAHVQQPGDIIKLATSDRMFDAIRSVPAAKAGLQGEKLQQLDQIIAYLELKLNTKWKDGVNTLLGGGVTFAVLPEETVLLIVESEDEAMLNQLAEVLKQFAQGEAVKSGEPDRVNSGDYRGVTGWSFQKDQAHAIIGNRLIATNNPQMLRTVVDLALDENVKASFAATSDYQKIQPEIGHESDAWVYVDMSIMNLVPAVQESLSQSENPWGALIIGGLAQEIGNSTWLLLTLDVEDTELHIELATDGKLDPKTPLAGFTQGDKSAEGALPLLNVPRQIAGLSLYRDLHTFYSAKDDLFPERTSSLIFFENMMGIFFSGRDLTDEVFGGLTPEVRVVIAEQQYDPDVTPDTQIPAFAIIFRMQDPERFSIVVEEAWQKAIGLVNFTSGQQANPGLIIDRPTHGEAKYTVARFAPPTDKSASGVEMRHNFSPSLAMPDDYVILASSESIIGDLIDALKAEKAVPLDFDPQTQNVFTLNMTMLSSILQANQETLVRQNMVEDGNSREEAELAIGSLISIVRLLGQLELQAGTRYATMHAEATLHLNLPEK